MEELAAFKATLVDMKIIRTRQCVQFIFEEDATKIPADVVAEILRDLAALVSGKLKFGIARLNELAHRGTPGTRQAAIPDVPGKSPQLSQHVGKVSGDVRFIQWLSDYRKIQMDKDSTAQFVRDYCGVKSRSEITPGSPAEQAWNLLESAYLTDNAP